ncbi:MAG: dihydrofolate reductase family protein [Candidatus Binatia bacterium]
MRKLIAAMKVSVDGMIAGPEGEDADWVESWSEEYGLTQQIDACIVGGGMYPDYEKHWNTIQQEPDSPHWLGRVPTSAEVEWARFAVKTPHYVVSSIVKSAVWPKTCFIRGVDDIKELKQQQGKDIYLMGGAQLTASLIDAGIVDELRLIIYPLIACEGKTLFATTERRRKLELRTSEQLPDGRLRLVYRIA